jgi:hypothetical protein
MKTLQNKLGALALSSLLFLGMFPVTATTTGCTKTQVVDLLNTLGNAGAAVAALEGNATVASTIRTDTAAAVTAVQNWQQEPSAAQTAIEALNLLATDLDLIPGTSQYAPLITLAIGTVDSLLALIPVPAATASVATAHSVSNHRSVSLVNPPKTAAQFKSQWNGIIKANPALAGAKI